MEEISSLRLVSLGGASITLGGLVTASLIIAAAFVLARVVGLVLGRLRARSKMGGPSIYIVQKLAGYGIILMGVVTGVSTLGVNLTSLAVFAGAVGVGVGLGLQGLVREFVSGLAVIFDQYIHVGDYVEVENGHRGEIVSVGPRATRIRNNDNVDVIVPNSHLIENAVVNWTLKGEGRRIHVPFSTAYGVDKDKVRDAVLEAARGVPFTLPDTETRRTQVWLVGFGESGLNFELVVWPELAAVKRPAAMNAAYTWAIEDALARASIEIPFQQMDLRVRSLFGQEGAAALKALRLDGEPPSSPEPPPPPTRNDAVEDLVACAEADAAAKAAAEGDAPGEEAG